MAAMTPDQLQHMIDAAIDSYVQRHPPAPGPPGPQGPQGPPGPQGDDGLNAGGAGNPNPRWNAADVGFFDPMYDDKSVDTGGPIAHTSKDTYFRDVHYFIRRANDIATVKGADMVRQNLWTCLRGTALAWWTGELTDNEKLMTTLTAGPDDKLQQWTRMLHSRFKPPSNIALEALQNERYTLRDAANRREPREYAQKILRLAMDASLDNVKNQLDTIYNGIDSSLRKGDIKRPKDGSTINGMLEDLDDCKQDWWDYGAKALRMQTRPQQQQPKPTQGGQYDSNNRGRSQPNFQRRPPPAQSSYNTRPNAYSTQSQNQNYGYGRQYPTYQNYGFQSNGSPFGQQANYGFQNRQSDQGRSSSGGLPNPSRRLQITDGQTTTSTQQSGSNSGSQGQQRQAFRSRPNQQRPNNTGRFGRSQAAYQASVEEEADEQPDQEKTESYHNEDEENDSQNSWLEDDVSQYDDLWHNAMDVNFVTPSKKDTVTHSCRLCPAKFSSKNKLFAHLREECWKSSPPLLSASPSPASVLQLEPETAGLAESSRRLIQSSASLMESTGHAFRGCHYATIEVRCSVTGKLLKVCVDTGCPMTMGDKQRYKEEYPDRPIKQRSSPIPVRGIGNTIHHTSEYATATFYLDGVIQQDGKPVEVTGQFDAEVHLVESLKANFLLGNDVLTAQRTKIDLEKQTIKLGSCQNLQAPISTVARKDPCLKRTVRTKGEVVVPAGATINVPVTYHGQLPDDRDFLFEPQCRRHLGEDGGVFAHIVDASLSHVMVRNTTGLPVHLRSRDRLGTVAEYNQQACYSLTPDAGFLATGGYLNKKSTKSWKKRLGMVAAAAAYAVSVASGLAKPSSPTADQSVNPIASTVPTVQQPLPATIDPQLETVLPSGITVYGSPDVATQLAAVADEFPTIWNDQGTTVDIPEEQWMPINLKPDASVKPARVYPVSAKDREVIDKTFDKMHADGKMTWSTQPTAFSFPTFVVWRDTLNGPKGRVVVDIRGLNKVTEQDTYPMPLQTDITSAVAGHRYISTVDAVGWFHQFLVKRRDRPKFTVVSHRGQEESNVALMGFKGSPPYVQRQTDQMLRPYREFSRAYMDDIIIFSKELDDHIQHLRSVFQLFQKRRVNLAPTKSFLGYPSITLLGQKVDSLGLSTTAEKIAAITSLQFPASLRELEYFLGLTGWLRHCIERYAQLAKPLQVRKTALTKQLTTDVSGSKSSGPARKKQSSRLVLDSVTDEEREAFAKLQDIFSSPIFLVHHDPERSLFVDLDASKRWGFAAMVYHVAGDPKDGTFARTAVQPILFLSKLLNGAEMNYWPTELEVAGIVWVVKHIRHMIDSSKQPPTIIYTDHSAAVPISRQTTLATSSTDKLNLRLVRASQYLSSFNIAIRHKAGKANIVPDALSRLPGKRPAQPDSSDKAGVLDALYGHPVELADHELRTATIQDLPAIAYHVTLVEMSDDFKNRLKLAYEKDKYWKKVLEVIAPKNTGHAGNSQPSPAEEASLPPSPAEKASQPPPSAEDVTGESTPLRGIRFRLKDGLIYYTSKAEGKDRLCIPASMEHEAFRIAHDLSSHSGFHRTYDRLVSSVYIRQLTKRLSAYIEHCPQCQLNQTKRHSPYGSLQPIITSAIPFHTIAIDFILALPVTSNGNDCAMSVTCKGSKRSMGLPGRSTYTAADWANVLITALMTRDWGIPRSIISDRDKKFMSDFWRAVFIKLGVSFLVSTAYHPQTDGQSERTNQTIEIALRFWLSDPENQDKDWEEALPYITAALNNSANASTGVAPNEICYGFRVNDPLAMLEDLPPQDYSKLRQVKRESAEEAIAFANVMHKRRYDGMHTDISAKLTVGSYAYLRLFNGYTIPGLDSRKLNQQRVGPFKILARIGTLAYRLELPPVMTIHPVISIAQLEPAPAPGADPYKRPRPDMDNPPPVQLEDDEDSDPENTAKPYEVERLLDRRISPTGQVSYLVKWRGYGPQDNVYYPLRALKNSMELVKRYDEEHPIPENTSSRERSNTRGRGNARGRYRRRITLPRTVPIPSPPSPAPSPVATSTSQPFAVVIPKKLDPSTTARPKYPSTSSPPEVRRSSRLLLEPSPQLPTIPENRRLEG